MADDRDAKVAFSVIREVKSVCLVLHVGEVVRGGIVTYLRTIVPAQRQRFGEGAVTGVYPACFATDLDGVFSAPHLVPWTDRRPLSLLRYGLAVTRAIWRIRPRLVHAHSTFAGVFVRVAVRAMPKQQRPIVIYCAHGWSFLQDIPPWKRRAYAMLERFLTPLADGVVHISADEARGAAEYGIKPALQATIPNGLPDEIPLATCTEPPFERKLTLLFVGRHDWQKGLDILLEAVTKVQRQDVVLHVVGGVVIPGTSVHLLTVDKRVKLHGWLDAEALRHLYRQSDVVVVPSRWEGFGFVALEAMRAGRAVFAADRGALPELVVDGETGRLFDLLHPDELARLIEMAKIQDLRQMGAAARNRYVMNFSADKTNDLLLQFYRIVDRRLN